MLASQRRTRILADLERTGAVRVADLVATLGVSDMTVRRDLEQLESQGRLRRVHGGAVAVGSSADEPGFEAKRDRAQPAKRAIALRAVELVKPRSAVGISAGTTTWMFAQELAEHGTGLSIVTNSTSVADALAAPHPAQPGRGHDVILTGGVRTPSAALVGPIADRAIESLHVDQLFLGVHGMDVAAGLTTPNVAEARTNAALVASAREIVVLADSSKLGVVGLATIAPLGVVDVLVTDDGLDPEMRLVLADVVGRLDVVPAPPPAAG